MDLLSSANSYSAEQTFFAGLIAESFIILRSTEGSPTGLTSYEIATDVPLTEEDLSEIALNVFGPSQEEEYESGMSMSPEGNLLLDMAR